MTSKSAKQSKKETKTDSVDDATNELNMAAMVKLLDQHRQALSAEFKAAISTLEEKIDRTQTTLSDHTHKIASLELNANDLDERVRALETTCATMVECNAKLHDKVVDLESRSRRNNIRIVGLPESLEGPRPSVFFAQVLADILGEDILPSPPEIDRAHRALVSKPATGKKPRPVIIRLHRYRQKELIVREARAKRGKLVYQGNPVAIYEDYAPEVATERAKYRSVMAELYNLGYKPTLFFPARLSIWTKDGGKKMLSSVTEAENFVAAARSSDHVP